MNKIIEKSVLFLGVGGVSMHQLAVAYKHVGYNVYGYDRKRNSYTKLCENSGIKVTTRFNKKFLDVNFAIKTGAIKNDDKYIIALKNKGIPIKDRAEILGELCAHFKCVIAVAGTHGKSTTASLIYEILRLSNKKVSCHIGADVFAPRFELNDDYLVVEACEYNKSFLSLKPDISVVSNIEPEHMDSYKSLFNLKNAFLTFLKRAKSRFVYLDDSTKYLLRHKNINFVSSEFKFKTKLKGEYNQRNIALAYAVTKSLDLDEKNILKAVSSFSGIPRRYEEIGRIKNTKIFIDYAHHPTEIKNFIETFKLDYTNCLIVFQPHTYSRTKNFLHGFVKVFKNVDNLYIFKEYPAREKKSAGKSAYELYQEIKKVNSNVKYVATGKKLTKIIPEFDAVAFVGAGDVDEVAKKIIKSYCKNSWQNRFFNV